MYIVIIGATVIGRKVARQLSVDNDVVVVDNNPKNLKRLENSFDGNMIEGIEFDKDVLHSAQVEQADRVIVCTESDNINIMAAQMLNKIFEIKNITLCLSSVSMSKLYKDSEFDIVCTTKVISNEIINNLNKERE